MTVIALEHLGGVPATTLTVEHSAIATTLSVASGTSWPDGVTGKFYATVGRGTATEERILVTARTGASLTGITRGVDGTTAAIHAAGVKVEHTMSALEFAQLNAHLTGNHAADDANLVHRAGVVTKTAAYTAVVGEFVMCDATLGAFIITLPAAPLSGSMVTVKKIDASANVVTVVGTVGVIDGDANALLVSRWVAVTFIWDGLNWLTKSTAREGYVAPAYVSAQVRPSVAQTVVDAGYTYLNWATEDWDPQNSFDPVGAPRRLTCVVAGRYDARLSVQVDLLGVSAPRMAISIIKNSSAASPVGQQEMAVAGGTYPAFCVFGYVDLVPGDWLEGIIYTDYTGGFGVPVTWWQNCVFSMTKVN